MAPLKHCMMLFADEYDSGLPMETARGGPVRTLRDSDVADNVSSVDMVDTPAGQVITAIALAEQAAGDSGHYGIGEAADQVVPEIPTLAAAGTPPGE